jgi:membrane-associated protein
VLAHRWLARYDDRIARGRDLVQRRAAVAIVAGRVVAVLRATTPALAGVVGVSRRTFLLWNVVGGLLWGVVFVGLGYLGATSAEELVDQLGVGPVVLAVVALTLLAGAAWRFSRRTAAPQR